MMIAPSAKTRSVCKPVAETNQAFITRQIPRNTFACAPLEIIDKMDKAQEGTAFPHSQDTSLHTCESEDIEIQTNHILNTRDDRVNQNTKTNIHTMLTVAKRKSTSLPSRIPNHIAIIAALCEGYGVSPLEGGLLSIANHLLLLPPSGLKLLWLAMTGSVSPAIASEICVKARRRSLYKSKFVINRSLQRPRASNPPLLRLQERFRTQLNIVKKCCHKRCWCVVGNVS